MDKGCAQSRRRSQTDVGKSPSRGSAFARIHMNRGHLGLCEPQINPEFARQKRRSMSGRNLTEGSFAEFQKNRGPRLGLTDEEHAKIGQTYSCIRQSRLNTEKERNFGLHGSRTGYGPDEYQYRTVRLKIDNQNTTSPQNDKAEDGKNSCKSKEEKSSCPEIEPKKAPSASDIYEKLIDSENSLIKKATQNTFTQRRIIRGRNNDKPNDHKDLMKSALGCTHFYGETTCQASYKPYTNSSYLPKARQRPIWAYRVVTSIGSGHWYLPFNHTSINSDYKVQYVTEEEVEKQQQAKRSAKEQRAKRKNRSEYSAEFQDRTHIVREVERSIKELKI